MSQIILNPVFLIAQVELKAGKFCAQVLSWASTDTATVAFEKTKHKFPAVSCIPCFSLKHDPKTVVVLFSSVRFCSVQKPRSSHMLGK